MLELIERITQVVFVQRWAAATGMPPCRFENVAFTQPSNGEWVSMFIMPTDTMQISLGNPCIERQLGIIMFQIFVPKNTGTRRADKIADTLSGIFRGQQWGYDENYNLYLQAGTITSLVGRTDNLTTEDGIDIVTEDGLNITTEVERAPMMFAILFRAPEPIPVSPRRDYFQINLKIPYLADKVQSA